MSLIKLRPSARTFLIFSDYACRPIRLSALMESPVIYIFTHDSIGLGEDGPTHQPVEQLAFAAGHSRSDHLCGPPTPTRWSEAWQVIMQLHHEPVALVLTRQALPTFDRTKYAPAAGAGTAAPTFWPTRRAASPRSC